ncbi:MAG: D-2-hydroxyacid dehydrogenase [Phycisphaeraceae bacterium]|nr:D-2-hydroxyacid dehydrogenase [Phycisphaeraceae bacterium]
MRIVILDSFTTDQGENCWTPFQALGALDVFPRTRSEQVAERIAAAEAVLTNKVSLTAAEIQAASHLKYVGVLATGFNVVDLDACRRGGIAVTNVSGYSARSVAQLVIAYLLEHAAAVHEHHQAVVAGRWAQSPDFSFTTRPLIELADKTLLILGSGAIGSKVATIAQALGMRILRGAVPGSTTPDRVPLDHALPEADFITLHCPLTDKTRHMVNHAFLAGVKPGAMLINTGRGDLIDEQAVIEALTSGRLARVALDVLSTEPPPSDHPLLDPRAPWADRLIITPHIAWATAEARARLVTEALANLKAFIDGQRRNRVD